MRSFLTILFQLQPCMQPLGRRGSWRLGWAHEKYATLCSSCWLAMMWLGGWGSHVGTTSDPKIQPIRVHGNFVFVDGVFLYIVKLLVSSIFSVFILRLSVYYFSTLLPWLECELFCLPMHNASRAEKFIIDFTS